MRLVRAEARKLRRPLTAWVLGLGALLAVMLAWGGLSNTHSYLVSPRYHDAVPSSCAQFGLPDGAQCAAFRRAAQAAQQREINASAAATRRDAVQDVFVEQPVGAGAMAGGLAASLPGAVLIALLAAGHLGGEWSGHTFKTVFTVEGRRGRVLAAKALSIWLTSLMLLAAIWAALAVTTPIWRSAYPLPVRHPTLGEQWAHTWPVVTRALPTLAVFSILAVAAGVLTRSVVGTLVASVGAVLAGLISAAFTTIANWTLGTWVSAWTRFPVQANVVSSYWSRVSGPDSREGLRHVQLGWAAALCCLVAFGTGCAAFAVIRLRRMDIG